MSTDRQHGVMIFECDSCDETFEIGSDDFSATWMAAKREGWKAEKIGDEWVHRCKGCA
jgi:hypothetical protein